MLRTFRELIRTLTVWEAQTSVLGSRIEVFPAWAKAVFKIALALLLMVFLAFLFFIISPGEKANNEALLTALGVTAAGLIILLLVVALPFTVFAYFQVHFDHPNIPQERDQEEIRAAEAREQLLAEHRAKHERSITGQTQEKDPKDVFRPS